MYRWIRSQPILYRFTLGTRILLALAFLPTGFVKLLGRRFATGLDQTEGGAGAFFEILFNSGLYWQFLGFGQMLAAILILWHRTSAVGAVMFLAIISNIFFITISYNFSGTWIVTLLMLLATIWLCLWDWNRIQPLIDMEQKERINHPELALKNGFEKTIYITGFIAGVILFSMMRGIGFSISGYLLYFLLAIVFICFIVAVGLSIKYRK